MGGCQRASNTILRFIQRPQHTSYSPFRLSPLITNTSKQQSSILNSTTQSTTSLSRRVISSTIRSQTNHTITKSALACEISSLRYTLLVNGEDEDAIVLGWDAGIVEDEDGT